MRQPAALFLGGSRWQSDVIRRACELGVRTVVADISETAPGRTLADRFVQLDTDDREGLLALARAERIDAVVAEQSDRVVRVAGLLNERLGLRGIDSATAHVFTDKYAMRKALAHAGISMPRYAEVRSADEASAHAGAWGYPVVVKPKTSQSSLGVFKVHGPAELRERLPDTLRHSRDGTLLVEEFVDGLELTVEAFSLGGRCHVLAVSEKAHYSFNPCVARRLAYPPRLDPSVYSQVLRDAALVVETLGLRDGISHAEYRLRGGIPYLVEVGARGGGNRIASVIVPHVSGVDVYEMLFTVLLGRDAAMPPTAGRAAVLEFFDFPAGRLREIRGVDAARSEGLAFELSLAVGPGDLVGETPDDRSRPGYFIVLAATRDEADAKAARVLELVRPEYAPRQAV